MADFNFVTSRLATGGALQSPDDVAALITAGISHVIDTRAEFDDTALLSWHCSCLWIGVPDDGQPKPPLWFDKGVSFALDALSRPHNRVLCHCAAGVNRGPSMLFAVLRALGIASDVAEAMIRKARPQVGLAYKNDANLAVSVLGYV